MAAGPLTAAMDELGRVGLDQRVGCLWRAAMRGHRAGAGDLGMTAGRGPRRAAAASARESTPATWAAAISPWEWPTTASGSTPRLRQQRGQRHHHRRTAPAGRRRRGPGPGASGGSPRRTSRSDQSERAGRGRPRTRRCACGEDGGGLEQLGGPCRATGSPGRGRRNGRPCRRPRCPVTMAGCGLARRPGRRARRRAVPPAPATTARCSKAARVVARE